MNDPRDKAEEDAASDPAECVLAQQEGQASDDDVVWEDYVKACYANNL